MISVPLDTMIHQSANHVNALSMEQLEMFVCRKMDNAHVNLDSEEHSVTLVLLDSQISPLDVWSVFVMPLDLSTQIAPL